MNHRRSCAKDSGGATPAARARIVATAPRPRRRWASRACLVAESCLAVETSVMRTTVTKYPTMS